MQTHIINTDNTDTYTYKDWNKKEFLQLYFDI